MPTALGTGASRGLGLALARALADRGWRLVIDARGASALEAARRELAQRADVIALAGDVADARHRAALVDAAGGRIDALVNNASVLGPSPQPALADYPIAVLEDVLRVNALAPLALVQAALPALPDGARVVNVTSDAAFEAYEGWGGYGSSKAALEQLTRILAVERAQLRVYAFDPGDMNTALHQEAFPGEDISDRPPPEDSVPALLELLEGDTTPEERGLARDDVRMLVARGDGRLVHARARDLPDFLDPGDLVVINTSATLPAALPARRADGMQLELRLSTPLPGVAAERRAEGAGRACEARWVVELRRGEDPFSGARTGDALDLPAGARAHLEAPYLSGPRLWAARLELPEPLMAYLARHGAPIRYRYVPTAHPLADYQTAYAVEPGSAEMPSAGRPLTPAVLTALVAKGVSVAPLILHTGVSSPEPGEGWTALVVTPERGVRAVDGLITGWHEPEASHLDMLHAVAGRRLVERSYAAALQAGYLWHEFGDL